MRALVTVVLGSLLLSSACGVEAQDELVAERSDPLSFGLSYQFHDEETWTRSGAQGLSGASFVISDRAVFQGREETWLSRDFDFGAGLPGEKCKVRVKVHFGYEEAYANLRVKIREQGSNSALVNHSYELAPSGPNDLEQNVYTPKWTMPASGAVVVSLIADKVAPGLWNSFEVPELLFSCTF